MQDASAELKVSKVRVRVSGVRTELHNSWPSYCSEP